MANPSSAGADDVASEFERLLTLRQDSPIKHTLPCSLEELYKGTTKMEKMTREVAKPSGSNSRETEELTIKIERGWGKGKEITFANKGNDGTNARRGDVVFTIDEKQHPEFTREGHDLIVKRRISLTEALTDYTFHLTTLDGRKLTVPINHVIPPNYQKIVPNEGMPIPGNPTMKGNLKIKFDISFPTSVDDKHKKTIRSIFGP